MIPTKDQNKIISAPGNIVIVANPGSGKTFVLSEKIKSILPNLLEYQGIIAISYTNKASQELLSRCLKNGLNPKASFFGTIDKFCISEIIIPFAKHLFGLPTKEINVVRQQDLQGENVKLFDNWKTEYNPENISAEIIKIFKELFLDGLIVLETVGTLALYIFGNNSACRSYLKARYTHIIVDEYQDSGIEQHLLFIRIKDLGLVSIAVGDANQSIFKFSGKSSEHLINLADRKSEFNLFPLDYNHRSDPSIINYSLLLLNENANLIHSDDIHVFEKCINGNEINIAQWLSIAIPKYLVKYAISNPNKVGILVRNGRTGKMVNYNLTLPNKYFESTPLDEDFTIWSEIFREILLITFDEKASHTQFIEKYMDVSSKRNVARAILGVLSKIRNELKKDAIDAVTIIDLFEKLAKYFQPKGVNQKSIDILRQVILTPKLLESYKPASENEIQVMTIHKSKGLEFDIVFHLDLYQWILPQKVIDNRIARFTDYTQDLNLHYVGITRAKKCCVLCHSNKRTNSNQEQKNGNPSEFLTIEVLKKRRKDSPF